MRRKKAIKESHSLDSWKRILELVDLGLTFVKQEGDLICEWALKQSFFKVIMELEESRRHTDSHLNEFVHLIIIFTNIILTSLSLPNTS